MYRHRESDFHKYFTKIVFQDGSSIYCHNVNGVIELMSISMNHNNIGYNRGSSITTFIDSSNTSLKAVFLYNSNTVVFLHMGYSLQLTGRYSKMSIPLDS